MPIEGIAGYPLSWPDGWKRTPAYKRGRSKYEWEFLKARDEVARHLRLMHARSVILSTNIPLRRDGLPLAGMREPEDPGVAAYWDLGPINGKPTTTRVIACDHWRTVRENMRAVAFALDALRQLDRCGASEILDRAYTGFTALPAYASTPNGSKPWRDVLCLGDIPITVATITSAYRLLAQQAHPDREGGHERMVELNLARDAALREIGAVQRG